MMRSTVTPRSASHWTAVQGSGGGGGGLVVVDLGVGDAGVVVDDGVDEGVAHLRAVPFLWLPGRRCPFLVALGAADVAPAAALWDVSELLHVHVEQRAGVGVLVAANRLTGRSVDVRQPVQPRRGEDAVHRRRRDTVPRRELNGPFPQPGSQADASLRRRPVRLGRRALRAR
jgi:hypothetical protein